MFKFLAKSILATLVLKRYRRIIVSTVVLFVFYYVVSLIYDDYVSFAQSANKEDSIFAALLVKWSTLVVGSLVYYWVNFSLLSRRVEPAKPRNEKNIETEPEDTSIAGDKGEPDPFAQIRRKRVLQSKGDIGLK